MERRKVQFTVDAALLRELGARLVGKPHIALAELIKNAYDADARHVRITFGDDVIVVEDDGHGMSAESFVDYWMRVGTTHKAHERRSPELGRPLTGSKGVGRLAAQLLASDLHIASVALTNPSSKGFAVRSNADVSLLSPALSADVEWDKAVRDRDLTKVSVPIVTGGARSTFVDGSACGTRFTLRGLTSEWDEDGFRALAREIWALQPPFEVDVDDEQAFTIDLVSDYGDFVSEFGEQMTRIFDTWQGHVSLSLEDDDPSRDVLFVFDCLRDYDLDEPDEPDDSGDADGDDGDDDELDLAERNDIGSQHSEHDHSGQHPQTPQRPRRVMGATKLLRIEITLRSPTPLIHNQYVRVPDCPVDTLEANIRVFNLANRQAHRIPVGTAREYMKTFGGIHIYDDKFRLPYYGPEDWLDIERDHARRLSRSQLVPENLRVSRGLNDLPSRRRLFGAAIISTAHEQETAPTRGLSETEALAIQVSRDRLSDNVAFGALRNLVRLGLDLYATEVARAKSAQTVGKRQQPEPTPRPSSDLAVVREIVEAVKPRLSNSEYDSLADYLTDAQQHAKVLEDTSDAQAALFGTLATVGMTTLAWEHEATKQRLVVLDAATSLKRALQGPPERLPATVEDQRARLVETAKRMNDVARLFRPVLDRESRETRVTLDARRFITRTAKQLDVLSRGAEVHTTGIPTDLKLPPGSSSGWSAILQNLLVNAFNAVLEEPRRDIDIDGGTTKNKDWIRIQDTGVGVDIADAENYFKPFVRGMGDDPRRAQLGLGGSGLGLTIVRMIADTMDVTVRFVAPEPPHSTAVIIEWKTTK